MVNECCLAGETWQRQHDGIRINKLEDTFCRRIFSAASLQGQTWRSARQIAMPKTENELKLALIRANRRETSIQCGFVFYHSLHRSTRTSAAQHNRCLMGYLFSLVQFLYLSMQIQCFEQLFIRSCCIMVPDLLSNLVGSNSHSVRRLSLLSCDNYQPGKAKAITRFLQGTPSQLTAFVF